MANLYKTTNGVYESLSEFGLAARAKAKRFLHVPTPMHDKTKFMESGGKGISSRIGPPYYEGFGGIKRWAQDIPTARRGNMLMRKGVSMNSVKRHSDRPANMLSKGISRKVRKSGHPAYEGGKLDQAYAAAKSARKGTKKQKKLQNRYESDYYAKRGDYQIKRSKGRHVLKPRSESGKKQYHTRQYLMK